MKFSHGYWLTRDGYTVLRPKDIDTVEERDGALVVYAPTAPIETRGDTLNRPLITTTFTAPIPDVIGVEIVHHKGRIDPGPHFALAAQEGAATITVADPHSRCASDDHLRTPDRNGVH